MKKYNFVANDVHPSTQAVQVRKLTPLIRPIGIPHGVAASLLSETTADALQLNGDCNCAPVDVL